MPAVTIEFAPGMDVKEVVDRLERYLRPRALSGGGFRAHQFTINGLTYPFIRNYFFAAVPDPPLARRYDMYSGLHLARPGDLLFFFQSDPQDPRGGINARRGMRGVYRVKGTPYRAEEHILDERSGIGYELLAKCPYCSTSHGTFSSACILCEKDFPIVSLHGKDVSLRVLSSWLDIEPLILFERSVSDERAYADFSDPGIIWTGRHDNAMGAGKGSSIRHLLPEEAIKLVRLLATEPEQHTSNVDSTSVAVPHNPLKHDNGLSIDLLPTEPDGTICREDELYYLLTRQLERSGSAMRAVIDPYLPHSITWDNLEFAASTFPWGYTGNAADYVLVFRNGTGRRLIVIIECKRDNAHDEAVLQTILYAERVLQVCTMNAPDAVPTEGDGVEILPIVIARNIKNRRGKPIVAIPKRYQLNRTFLGSIKVKATVQPALFLRYLAPAPEPETPPEYRDVFKYTFQALPTNRVKEIEWTPEAGAVGTAVESSHILSGTWEAARAAAGI